jgi:hypothetical protein
MAGPEPDLAQIQDAISGLLREEEVATLATVDPDGWPPPGGYDDRFATRSLQVKGRASLLTTTEEIQRAVAVSQEQFPWLAQTAMYDNVKLPDQGQQVFFRIDPVTAVWADHRVRLLWRVFLEFDAAGAKITAKHPYDAVVGRRG